MTGQACRQLLLVAIFVAAASVAHAAQYAALVMDARTGEVYHSRNADTRLHPASLTKMMTLYVAFEAVRRGEISLDTRVRVSANAAAEVPSKIGLRAGMRIPLRYLIRAASIKSANDAATAIAEAIGGSEAAFAQRMTTTARALGMTQTTFRNAHGLTASGHLSTARDMAILGRRLVYDYPQYYNLFSRMSADVGIGTVRNTNWRVLENIDGADGIKTGYTRAAGHNLVASAQRGSERIIVVVFGMNGSAARAQRVSELLDLGFAQAPSRAPTPRFASLTYAGATPATTPQRRTVSLASARRPRPRPTEAPTELAALIDEAVQEVVAELDGEPGPVEPEVEGVVVAGMARPRPRPVYGSADDAEDPVAELIAAELGAEIGPDPAVEAAVEDSVAAETTEAGGTEVAALTDAAVEDAALTDAIAELLTDPPADAPEAESALANAESEPAEEAAPERQVRLAAIRPRPRPTTVQVAPATPAPPPAEVALAVTGPRRWSVDLGVYGTENTAERLLLQTALADMQSLQGAERRVVNSARGWSARFVGLTQVDANKACQRLRARGQACETVAY